MIRKHRLIEEEWPEFGTADPPLPATIEEYEQRITAARSAMDRERLSHLVIYGDREHFANLAYLTGFDPRFEESLLIIRKDEKPLLLVGNECEGYLPVSPLFNDNKLRTERFQSFSLLSQPRGSSRLLKDIFAAENIGAESRVGCVGWKYFSEKEHPLAAFAIDLPAYMVDTLRDLAGRDNVVNATAIFMNPDDGLRTNCSAAEIAYFEYTNVLASEGMKRMLFAIREGISDFDLARYLRYNGEPLNCHMTLVTDANRSRGLSGPAGATIKRGSVFASNIGYWGSNICRAGWVASGAADLPVNAQDYVENFAGPYFEIMGEWFAQLRLDTPGGQLYKLVMDRLPFEEFGIFLNPGHLIHLDEWVSSPIFRESDIRLRSGMVFQVDVIPSSPVYFSTRMEDGIVLADSALRAELQRLYPDCFARCRKRWDFMRNTLGIDVPPEVLPLSNIPAIVPPLLLSPHSILALEN